MRKENDDKIITFGTLPCTVDVLSQKILCRHEILQTETMRKENDDKINNIIWNFAVTKNVCQCEK